MSIKCPEITDDAKTTIVWLRDTKDRVVVRAPGALDDAGLNPGGELVFDGGEAL